MAGEEETPQAAQTEDDNMPPVEEENSTIDDKTAELETSPEASAPLVETGSDFIPEEVTPEKVQARFNTLTAKAGTEKRRADALEIENAELKANQPHQPTTAAPKLEDFDFDQDKFNDALLDYKVEQGLAKQQATTKAADTQQEATRVQTSFNENVEKMLETAPDWNEVAGTVPLLPKETLDTVMNNEKGAEIVYYLGQNPEVANEVATANPMDAAVRIGQITALLGKPKPSVKTSAAPEPITPVTSGGSVGKSLEEMSMEEIMELE